MQSFNTETITALIELYRLSEFHQTKLQSLRTLTQSTQNQMTDTLFAFIQQWPSHQSSFTDQANHSTLIDIILDNTDPVFAENPLLVEMLKAYTATIPDITGYFDRIYASNLTAEERLEEDIREFWETDRDLTAYEQEQLNDYNNFFLEELTTIDQNYGDHDQLKQLIQQEQILPDNLEMVFANPPLIQSYEIDRLTTQCMDKIDKIITHQPFFFQYLIIDSSLFNHEANSLIQKAAPTPALKDLQTFVSSINQHVSSANASTSVLEKIEHIETIRTLMMNVSPLDLIGPIYAMIDPIFSQANHTFSSDNPATNTNEPPSIHQAIVV